jgi:predicted PurR-regulated permease PerM
MTVSATLSRRAWVGLAVVAFLLLALWLLGPIVTPFLLSVLLAYLFDPLVDRLEARGLSRDVAVCIVFLLPVAVLVAVPLLLVPVLDTQVQLLIASIPVAVDWARDSVVPWLETHFGVDPALFDIDGFKRALAEHWRQAGGVAANVIAYATRSGFAVMSWVASVVLVPVVTFYTLRDWDRLVAAVHDLLPRGVEPTVSALARQADEALAAFLRGQLIVMLALGSVYAVGLWLCGLKLAVLVGLVAGLVSFVPYLGSIVGIAAAAIAMLVQTGDAMQLIPVALVFAVGQTLEGFWLTPKLVGDRIRLHPVAVIFAVMAGGQLFGFLGVLLALPVTAVLAVLVRWAHREYKASDVYHGPGGGDGEAEPPGRA